LYGRFGPKWSVIAHGVPGRSDNAIKNRWNSSISKRIETDEMGERILTVSKARKYCRRKFTELHRPIPLAVPSIRPTVASFGNLDELWPVNEGTVALPQFEGSVFDNGLDVGDYEYDPSFDSSLPHSNWELASPIGQNDDFF
jgi:hypothetical protein